MASRTVYYAAMSLDGYIAEPEEKLEWLTGFNGPGSEVGRSASPIADSYPEFIRGIGSMAMGSKTYAFLLAEASWPYEDMPIWVYTRRELPTIEGANLTFTSGDVAELHAEMLDAAAGKDLWVIGGGDLASQYVAAGLLDLVRVTVVPIVLGAGLPLFAEPLREPMKLLAVTPFENGMVELSYEVVR